MIHDTDEKLHFIKPEEALKLLDTETLIHIVDSVNWYIAKNEYAHFEEMHNFFRALLAGNEHAETVLSKISGLYGDFSACDVLEWSYGYEGCGFAFDTVGIGVDLV
jgi:hypothetical protein